MIKQIWDEHLSQLPPKVAETKKRRSGYWKNWYREIDLGSDDPVVGEPDFSDPEWSIDSSTPIADAATRGRPPEQDQQRQDGRPEAKSQLPDGTAWSVAEAEESATPNLSEVVSAACAKFEYFFCLSPGEPSPVMINARSSLTVVGWVDEGSRGPAIQQPAGHSAPPAPRTVGRTSRPAHTHTHTHTHTMSRSPASSMPSGRVERDAAPLSELW